MYSKFKQLRPPFCWHATCRGYRTASGNGLLPGAPVLFRFAAHGWRLRVLDLEALVTATVHLQVGFRKSSLPSDANPRGEETCNVNFGIFINCRVGLI